MDTVSYTSVYVVMNTLVLNAEFGLAFVTSSFPLRAELYLQNIIADRIE